MRTTTRQGEGVDAQAPHRSGSAPTQTTSKPRQCSSRHKDCGQLRAGPGHHTLPGTHARIGAFLPAIVGQVHGFRWKRPGTGLVTLPRTERRWLSASVVVCRVPAAAQRCGCGEKRASRQPGRCQRRPRNDLATLLSYNRVQPTTTQTGLRWFLVVLEGASAPKTTRSFP